MNRLIALGGAAGAAAVVAAGIAGAHGSSHPTASAAKAAPEHARVAVRSSSLGRHLVDASSGRTLYRFMRDDGHRSSTCTHACAQEWPPLRSRGTASADAGVSHAHLARIHRADGARQVTYHGHPLYEFSGDTGRNQTHGQGINAFGGRWYIVSPSGSVITRTSASKPMNVPPTYGTGY
jgi:predicted lipoprotein with Yx(FWY)xxD motif